MDQKSKYIRDNMRYDPSTGRIWWTKPLGKRDLDEPIGSVDGKGYLQVNTPHGNLRLHRVAWFLHYGVWPLEKQIDHINGIKADNRIENLRLATNQQNLLNSKSHKDNVYSGYKGVSFHKRYNKWVSRFSGKHLGYFKSESEAAEAYDKHVRSLGNAYTRGNKISP